MKQLLNKTEACMELWGYKDIQILNELIKKGEIIIIEVGGRVYVPFASIQMFIKNKMKEAV